MALTHLEFSFHLTTCNLSDRTRTFPNPFTGKPETVPVDDGLTADECSALRAVTHTAGFIKSPIPGEGYELQLSQDEAIRLRGEIEVAQRGFEVEIVVRSLPDHLLDLVLPIAHAGNLALTSSTGEHVRLLEVPTTELIDKRWPNAPLVRSRPELRHWLDHVICARPVRVGPA